LLCFASTGTAGPALWIGLSWANLKGLSEIGPITVELAPYGGHGALMLALGDEGIVTELLSGSPGLHVVVLTGNTLDTLRAGELVEIPLHQLGVPGFAVGVLFAGQTEYELIAALRLGGLLPPETVIEGLEEYQRHGRNEVEDCVFCQERRHGLPAGFSPWASHSPRLSAATAPAAARTLRARAPRRAHRLWSERIYQHPYLFFVLAVVVVGGLAVLIETC
jgi:hypothetical protein